MSDIIATLAHILLNVKKSISVAFGFVGTVIGAGFASGKEIMLYFSETNVFTPLLSALLLGLFSYLFCEIGRTTNGDGYTLFGRGKNIFSFVIRIANLLIFCTTIAACEEVIYELIGIHGGSILTVLLTLSILHVRSRIASTVSVLSVLVIIVLLLYMFFLSNTRLSYGKFSPLSAFLYAGMNMLTGGFFITQRCKGFSKKDSVKTAAISFTLLSILVIVVYVLCQNDKNALFPVLSVAKELHLGTVGNSIMYLAMLTTCIGTMAVASQSDVRLALGGGSIALIISCFGFEKLIGSIYPIIGAIGCISVVICVLLHAKKSALGENLNVLIADNTDKSIL